MKDKGINKVKDYGFLFALIPFCVTFFLVCYHQVLPLYVNLLSVRQVDESVAKTRKNNFISIPSVFSATNTLQDIDRFIEVYKVDKEDFKEKTQHLLDISKDLSNSGDFEKDVVVLKIKSLLISKLLEYLIFVDPNNMDKIITSIVDSPIIDMAYLKGNFEKQYSINIDIDIPYKKNQYGKFYYDLTNDLFKKTPETSIRKDMLPKLNKVLEENNPVQLPILLSAGDSFYRLLEITNIISLQCNKPVKDITEEEYISSYTNICNQNPDLQIQNASGDRIIAPEDSWRQIYFAIERNRVPYLK